MEDRHFGIDQLEGKTIKEIVGNKDSYEIEFRCIDEKDKISIYKMYHEQDCCENVYVEDIIGDLEDLLNTPILNATEESNTGELGEYGDSSTWTFYRIATIKGTVTIRWFGTSNGYYSESVIFVKV